MNVGIFFNARRNQGGLYQYAVTLVRCLHAYEQQHHYTLFCATLEPVPLDVDGPRWQTVVLPHTAIVFHLAIEMALMTMARFGWRWAIPGLPSYREVEAAGLDVMLYSKPSIQSFLWPYPAVFPIHDLQHLFQPEFPEVSARGEWARREYVYRHAVPRAAAILADSEIGREDISKAYGASPGRVHALPHLAPIHLSREVTDADIARVRARYHPPEQFLFYPAAFWPHKNHVRLLHALRLLKDQRGTCLPLLLAGSRSRTYSELVKLTAELGLTDQVHFLGYVPDEDIYPLYRLALALVMPTFFGPTNIPYLEAWALDCPVITSNVRGLPEQVGDAGLLVDPRDDHSIAEAIWRVYSDSDLRRTLVEHGRRKMKQWTPRDFAKRLGGILSDAVR